MVDLEHRMQERRNGVERSGCVVMS